MRKMTCDVCGAEDRPLTELREIYRTKDVVDVCPKCEDILAKRLSKIRDATSSIMVDWMKRFITVLKENRRG